MKRLVVCCDGTWQDLSKEYPTNVVKMAQAVKTEGTAIPQIVFYGQGIGSGGELLNRVGGGAFGWGIDENIQDAYRFLCLNYDRGDEIYLFGFSRGAYTVRSLAGLIRCAGGLLPRNEVRQTPRVYDIYRSQVHKDNKQDMKRKAQEMQQVSSRIRAVRITLLGCWDTVGSLGVPQTIPLLSKQVNKKYQFHDYQLSNIIDHALHAVAIDERRKVFDVTPMEQSQNNINDGQKLRQVWFPGDHGCVGGGTKDVQGLSDAALEWMIKEMQAMGLGLELDPNLVECDLTATDPAKRYGIHPNHAIEFTTKVGLLFRMGGLHDRPIAQSNENPAAILEQRLHESVMKRWNYASLKPPYRPENLKKFKDAIEEYLKRAAQAAQEVVEKAQETVQDVAGKTQEVVDNLADMATDRTNQ
ncbi:DUF2235 domain-containing protein [Egbenema bharatensis]|uniref:DUF2235 domain-containing protein n=1 Tax=Egbenema bharatensis TaxID=3463334 RepID=UPI003A8B6BD8